MAEGGYYPMDTPTEETPLIPDTGDDDDDMDLFHISSHRGGPS